MTDIGAIQQATYNFLLSSTVNVSILYHFQDIVTYLPKFKFKLCDAEDAPST